MCTVIVVCSTLLYWDPSHIHISNSKFFRDFLKSFNSGSEEGASDRKTLIAGSGDRDRSDEAAPKPSKPSGYRSVQFCYTGYSRSTIIIYEQSILLGVSLLRSLA